MPTLADLQRSFTEFLLSSPGARPDPALCNAIREDGIPAERRLAIYKNNVYAQLIGALKDSYPAVHRLTGDAFFRFAANEYIKAHPSRSPTLRGYGEHFPSFLGSFAPASSVPYLSDVARLELLYLESYHAAEVVPLPKEAFAALVSERTGQANLMLHPSTRLMTSPFPVSRIWEVNRQPSAIADRRRISGGPEYLLIVRPQTTVEVRRVACGAYAALVVLSRECSMAEALEAGSEAEPAVNLVRQLLSLADGETFCLREERP